MDKNKLQSIKRNALDEDSSLIQRGLSKIYSNKDGSLPDISHLDVRRRSKIKIFFFGFAGLIIVLSVLSWLGFLIFNPDFKFGEKSIDIKVEGPQNVASGDEIKYVIEYKNLERVDLKEVELLIRYPDGFEFTQASPVPTNNFNSSWKIGSLTPGSRGTIEIAGRLIGEVGSIKTINVTASYQPQNFSSVFKETASFSSQITSSILEVKVEGSDKVLSEKQTSYKIKYKNTSDQDLKNIKIQTIYPSNFVFQDANPKPYTEEDAARNLNNEWFIDELGKKQEGEIEITGGFLSQEGADEVAFTAQIGFFNPENDEFSLQQEQSIKVQIVSQNLSVNLIIAGSNQNQPVNFGQTLLYSIAYKNLGKQDLDDVSFTLHVDSDVIDFSGLEDKNGGVVKDNTITWNKDQISQLDLVRALDEGTIDLSFKIKEVVDINVTQTDLQTKSYVTANFIKIGDIEVNDLEVKSNEIQNNINTDIQLKVEGRYFDDDNIAVGSGPLPPVVGQKTSFRVFWSIANSLHEVKDVTVTTKLPDGVEWADKYLVKAGTIAYSEKDNTITWSIAQIPANKNFDEVNVWFDVSVVPTKQQVRKLLILTDQTTMTAVDKETESQISRIGKAITSNLEDDPIGGGRGLVIDITE